MRSKAVQKNADSKNVNSKTRIKNGKTLPNTKKITKSFVKASDKNCFTLHIDI